MPGNKRSLSKERLITGRAEVARQQFSRNQTARLRDNVILRGELAGDSSKIGQAPRALKNAY